jgi:serine/threonine-protein kinase Chk2
MDQEHIVRIIELIEAPDNTIELHLEPVFGGTLRRRLPLAYPQGLEVIRQCLSALAYLHGQSTPIVHRDIKPDNILVDDSPQGTIHIKLADFGFSREDRDLKTPLGTPLYNAPEICEARQLNHDGQTARYSPAVDIWSLGVVAAQCLHNLPSSAACGLDWCEEVVKHILTSASRRGDPGLYRVLLSHMVVIDPSRRASAQQCHDQVVSLLSTGENPTAASSDRAGQTPSPGSSRPFHESDEGRPHYGVKRLPAGFHPPNSSTSPLRGHYGMKRLPATPRPATILPTIESDDDTAASPPADSGTPSRARSRRQHPYRATPYPPPAHHRNPASRQSPTSSMSTITPGRTTRSTTRAARTAPASGNAAAPSTAAHFSRSRVSTNVAEDDDDDNNEEEDNPRPLPSGPESAESSYLAAGYVLNPLWFGSELVSEVRRVAGGEGEEVALSSVATTTTGVAFGMQSSVVQAPQRQRGEESVVVLTDDWLYLPVEDGGNGV